jgi:hypothetical protein
MMPRPDARTARSPEARTLRSSRRRIGRLYDSHPSPRPSTRRPGPVSAINIAQLRGQRLMQPPAALDSCRMLASPLTCRCIGAARRCEAMVAERREEVAKESVSLDAKRAFPFRVYGRARPAGTASSTAVPGVC